MNTKNESESEQQKKERLRMCIMFNVVLFMCIAFCVVLFSDENDNKYLRYGPNEDLNILGVKINTWKKYISLQLILIIIQSTDVLINDIANPILRFNIYNPSQKVIKGFTRSELQLYANIHWLVNALRGTLTVLLTISQLDLAILRVIYGEITSFFTIRLLLKEKEFPDEDKNKKIYSVVAVEIVEIV